MDLEFLTVGVARGNIEDLHTLYNRTHNEVFGLALSIVKDVGLAGDVTAEVYRRVKALAYLFNSDMSAEYWLLDMAKNLSNNAAHNPDLSAKVKMPRQYNLSSLLMELVNKSKNDRAAITMLFIMSELGSRDIARILWYKTGSAKNEYKRAIARLSDRFKEKSADDIRKEIKRDTEAASPDVWNKVIQEEETALSSVSHEELGLSEDTLLYSEEDAQKAIEEKHKQEKKRSKRIKVAVIIIAAVILLNIGTILIYNILKKDSDDGVAPDVQFGNRLAVVELADKAYYQNTKDNNKLYEYDTKSGKSALFADAPVKEIITDGESIFYRNYDDGKIYRIKPGDSESVLLTDTPASCLTYNDGKIYFSDKLGISYIDTDGKNETLLADISEDSDDYKYYESQGVYLFRYLMKFDDTDKLYFSAGAGKGIYHVEDFGDKNGVEAVYFGEAYTFDFYRDEIYFDVKSVDDAGNSSIRLCKLDENGLAVANKEFLLGTGAYAFSGDTLYFDGTVENETGIFRLDMSKEGAKPEKISGLRASDIYISGTRMYVYYPGDLENSGSYFKILDLANEYKEVSVF